MQKFSFSCNLKMLSLISYRSSRPNGIIVALSAIYCVVITTVKATHSYHSIISGQLHLDIDAERITSNQRRTEYGTVT